MEITLTDKNTEYTKRSGFKITEKKKNTTDHIMGFLKCIRIQQVHISSLHLKYDLQNIFLNLFPMSLNLRYSQIKLVYLQIENFCKNAKFLSNYKTFWVLQNSDTMIHLLNNIKKACQIYCNI